MRHTAIIPLWVLLATGCSGAVEARQEPPPPPPHVCTGPEPAHAGACPGGGDPQVDTGRYLTAACSGAPCSYACYSDHYLEQGACVARPLPPSHPAALVDTGDGTLEDVDTGLRWLARPGCAERLGGIERPSGALPFNQTKGWISALSDGACGLADGSLPGTWRLPTIEELVGLWGVARTDGGPFEGAPAGDSWSLNEPCSTTTSTIDPVTRNVAEHPKGDVLTAWPVRAP